jgi:murein L,D-transpeptidase YafK
MQPKIITALRHVAAIAALGLVLAACSVDMPKDMKPVPSALKMKMEQLGMSETSPIFIRIFKEESEFEVWKQRKDGKYQLLTTYSICKWSGDLGPKKVEGDRQAPEGFYTVTPAQMNPNSSYYLSFDIGYPNAFDRALGRTGANLMVHGACSSRGCYSMTDDVAGQIFAMARDSFRGGQTKFELEAFPFRMTPENMARHRNDPNVPFWKMLKDGYDHFEVTQVPPKVDVCNKRYVFNADAGGARFTATAACPAYTIPEDIKTALAAKQETDEAAYRFEVARLEAEDAKKVAADAKQQAADAKKVADMQQRQQERDARAAAKADDAATATTASLTTSADAPKKDRFAFIKRLLGRDKPAAEATANATDDFDAGAGARASAVPVPIRRPTSVAGTPPPVKAAKAEEGKAAPADKPTQQAATTPVPPAKSAAPATPPKATAAAPAEDMAPLPGADDTADKPAEPPAKPAIATPAAPEKKQEEKNFDDVFG